MENKKRLVYSIIQYLHDQLHHGGLSPDVQESLEASIQCLETAFEVTVEDRALAVPQTLPEIFKAFLGKKEMPSIRRNSDPNPLRGEVITEAERLKTEGNEQMKIENFEAAVSSYGKAIELNPANAVYFCNRAAAYSKLGNYAGAVEDCKRAIGIDPYYSKAYGRMGVALSSLKKHKEAVDYYKKALKLDPDNVTYKSNLRITEEKMKEMPGSTRGSVGCNLAGSSFWSVASNLMNNPQIRQIMAEVMSGGHNPSGATRASRSPNVSPSFMQRGQQFAQQMQQQNPELIEQLRSQARNWTPSASKNQEE